MSTLQGLCDDSSKLYDSAVDMLRVFVTESHRKAVPFPQLRDAWTRNFNIFHKQIAEIEETWREVCDCWSGGQSIIAPESLERIFEDFNSLMSSKEVTLWSFDKIFERIEEVLPDATPHEREQCQWFLSRRLDLDAIRTTTLEMRAEFDSVMRAIRQEAEERGITEQDLFREEMDARAKLASINPTVQEWHEIASRSGAPEYMKDDSGGPCPL